MLSVCIPVFNYSVEKLVKQLTEQCEKSNIPFEINIFEDGSDDKFVEINKNITNHKNTNHLISQTNIGRSAARNHLANISKFDKLIFLDCDSEIPSDQYIKKYIENSKNHIVCGGTIYLKSQYRKELSLRYKYGIKREMTSAELRNKQPNVSFTTNNFLISKSIFDKIKFREFLKDYGHEDSLFGFELKQNNISIKHIDNPVIHCGLETNKVFLDKSLKAINNLVIIKNNTFIDPAFTNDIRLIRNQRKATKIGLNIFVKLIFNKFEKTIRNHLIKSTNPSLFWFNFYKLAYYTKLVENEKAKIKRH
ncbi:MAG: glycosyltransferase family 2 protein [Bacteroidales bacterium]|nr:glycosyltransferase family 2 protein [Bacteroidales bacterium]